MLAYELTTFFIKRKTPGARSRALGASPFEHGPDKNVAGRGPLNWRQASEAVEDG